MSSRPLHIHAFKQLPCVSDGCKEVWPRWAFQFQFRVWSQRLNVQYMELMSLLLKLHTQQPITNNKMYGQSIHRRPLNVPLFACWGKLHRQFLRSKALQTEMWFSYCWAESDSCRSTINRNLTLHLVSSDGLPYLILEVGLREAYWAVKFNWCQLILTIFL